MLDALQIQGKALETFRGAIKCKVELLVLLTMWVKLAHEGAPG